MDNGFKFDANDQPLAEVFFGNERKYRIPRYQRPYAWSIDQISDFWDDLFLNERPYYLGSFIFNTEYEAQEKYLDIIDGQQRLVTITILLAVLRDVTKSFDKEQSDLIQRQDIGIQDWEGNFSYRIKTGESLQDYFIKFIQSNEISIDNSNPETLEQKRVFACYEFLKEKIIMEINRVPSNKAKLDTIKKLRKKIRDLMVINIEITQEEDAYDIFETTNARGMELSVSDLLKNLIFKYIVPGDNKDFAKEVWKDITKNIEETNIELKRFIRYFWLSKYHFVQEKRLYKAIKNNITDEQMVNFLISLRDDSINFNMLLEGDERDFEELGAHYKKIFQSVFAIRLMGVTQCFVLLLSILRNFPKLGFDPYKTFQLVENFTFKYSAICKLPGNRVEKIYSKYAIEIEKAAFNGPSEKVRKDLNSIFDRLTNELIKEIPSEGLFNENFSEVSYKKSTQSRMLLKYIMEKINSYYSNTDEYLINFDTVNIEHLLPQNPDKEWSLSKSQISEYVNKLGNLTLLSEKLNSKIQNAMIAKKLPLLKKSKLDITKKVVEYIESENYVWGKDQIITRQKKLAEISYENIWQFKN